MFEKGFNVTEDGLGIESIQNLDDVLVVVLAKNSDGVFERIEVSSPSTSCFALEAFMAFHSQRDPRKQQTGGFPIIHGSLRI
jgi:hypothetical protein